MKSDRPFIVAHRSANSLDGLRAAHEAGADLCEGDVHLFWGRLEVRHLKTIGPIPILWDRWFLANPFGPRLLLGELLRACPPTQRIMLDLKGVRAAVGRRVRRELVDFARPVVVCSRNWAALEPLMDLEHATVVHSVGSPRQLRELLRRYGPGSLSGISIQAELLTAQVVQELLRRTAVIMSWPVTSRAQAEQLIAWGVRGLITSTPEVVALVD